MLNLLIWSKDRACQLDCLIRSVNRRSGGRKLFSNIIVLYKTSSEEFELGYQKLKQKHVYVNLINETNLCQQTKDIIEGFAKRGEKVCLSTDDTVFFSTPLISQQEIVDLFHRPDVVTFSFRYGFNTVMQNCHTGEYQPALNIYQDEGKYICWNSDDYHQLSNYGYPFGLDMHVYDADMLHQLIKNMEFKNTNQLETGLFNLRNVAPRIICSEKHSTAVNVPCNNMSGITIAGQNFPFTIENLNQLYLEGGEVDLASFDNINFVGCHQEVELRFKKS